MKQPSKTNTTPRKTVTLTNLEPTHAPKGGHTTQAGSAGGGIWYTTTNSLTLTR